MSLLGSTTDKTEGVSAFVLNNLYIGLSPDFSGTGDTISQGTTEIYTNEMPFPIQKGHTYFVQMNITIRSTINPLTSPSTDNLTFYIQTTNQNGELVQTYPAGTLMVPAVSGGYGYIVMNGYIVAQDDDTGIYLDVQTQNIQQSDTTYQISFTPFSYIQDLGSVPQPYIAPKGLH